MRKTWLGLAASALMAVAAGKAYAADLTVWGLQAFNPAADAYIGELVKEYGKSKNISAEYVVVPANVLNDKLAAAFAAGAPPDAFMNVSAQGLYYMSQGLTAPLDDVLADMRKVPGGIYENTMPQAIYDGKVQALPIEIDISPMFVRKDLLAKVAPVTQPRFALLNPDVQDAIFQAATSVATSRATPEEAANTLQKSAEAAAK